MQQQFHCFIVQFQNEFALKSLQVFCIIIQLQLTRPRGPILGAKDEVAGTSPPTAFTYTKERKCFHTTHTFLRHF